MLRVGTNLGGAPERVQYQAIQRGEKERTGEVTQPHASHRLALVPLLRGVDDGRLGRLAAQVTERRFGHGQTVRTQGEPADRLPLLLEGTVVALRTTSDGRELRLGQLVGPCALDKTAVLDGEGHTATFRAHGECLVWSVARADFLGLIDDVAALRQHVMVQLASSVREQTDRLVETAFANARQRVASWLVRSLPDVGTTVPLPSSQQVLAETLGLNRVTVNRALKALERDGLVRVARDQVVVLVPELLAAQTAAGR
jgi:CRP/FNR family cyclic AMP-dependent transcriptional regulator